MKSFFHIFPIKSRLFPLNPVYSPALGILFDGFIKEAYSALVTFFDDAVRREYQKILIIHGKGNHSQNGPVLARFVQKFLETHTHAGETGHPKGHDGGTGSTWVILK